MLCSRAELSRILEKIGPQAFCHPSSKILAPFSALPLLLTLTSFGTTHLYPMCDRELLDETTLSGGPLQAQATVTEFSPLRIGIIGGGIGGTALALACQRLSEGALVATIFERDSSFDARSQGYGLTMQQV